MKQLYIIAGPNGAGKTTASYTLLPEMLDCREFVNADEIARGLSPFQPDKASFRAGRLMLERIGELIKSNEDFAFETTLATKSHVQYIKEAMAAGYSVTLLFFWLNSPELAVRRVATRAKEGGHDIPEAVIRRRYDNGLKNFFNLFRPLVNSWFFIDNSVDPYEIIAIDNQGEKVFNSGIWQRLNEKYDGK